MRMFLSTSLLVMSTACVVPAGQGGGAAAPTGAGGDGVAAAVTASALADAPIVFVTPQRPLNTRLKAHGIEGTGCSSYTTAQPIASFELRETVPKLAVQVRGVVGYDSSSGFILRSGDQLYKSCDRSGQLDASALPPGRYDVYPAMGCMKYTNEPDPNREGYYNEVCHESVTASVWLYSGSTAMPTTARQQVTLGKLDRPTFVEVTLAPRRMVVPQGIAGRGCENDAFTLQPDVILDLSEPKEGVIVRVLPTAKPVSMAMQEPADEERTCLHDDRRYKFERPPNAESHPTYRGGIDLSLDGEANGKVALWLGSKVPADTTKVTLMIVDKTTQFEPLAVFEGGHPRSTVEDRWLGAVFPQLMISTLSNNDARHETFVAAAAVFAATPPSALVYAKRELPGENSAPAIAKDEPLAVLGFNEDAKSIHALTADGLTVYLKSSAYGLAPPAQLAFPATPRPADADIWVMLPPEHAPKAAAYGAKFAKLADCRERAVAPYRARLPKVMPGFVIASKSPEYVRIENAGYAAQDKKCGTKEQLEKKLAPELAKLSKLVDAERARLLAVAIAPHKH